MVIAKMKRLLMILVVLLVEANAFAPPTAAVRQPHFLLERAATNMHASEQQHEGTKEKPKEDVEDIMSVTRRQILGYIGETCKRHSFFLVKVHFSR